MRHTKIQTVDIAQYLLSHCDRCRLNFLFLRLDAVILSLLNINLNFGFWVSCRNLRDRFQYNFFLSFVFHFTSRWHMMNYNSWCVKKISIIKLMDWWIKFMYIWWFFFHYHVFLFICAGFNFYYFINNIFSSLLLIFLEFMTVFYVFDFGFNFVYNFSNCNQIIRSFLKLFKCKMNGFIMVLNLSLNSLIFNHDLVFVQGVWQAKSLILLKDYWKLN